MASIVLAVCFTSVVASLSSFAFLCGCICDACTVQDLLMQVLSPFFLHAFSASDFYASQHDTCFVRDELQLAGFCAGCFRY
jgi:hypothetical protein